MFYPVILKATIPCFAANATRVSYKMRAQLAEMRQKYEERHGVQMIQPQVKEEEQERRVEEKKSDRKGGPPRTPESDWREDSPSPQRPRTPDIKPASMEYFITSYCTHLILDW